MEIVLQRDYAQLGQALEVITVRDGYARNFLIPQGIAVPATEGNKRAVTEARSMSDKKYEKRLKEAKGLAQKVEKVPCTIPVRVGEGDKIFGSVTGQEIADLLNREGFKIDKRSIALEEPIKELGVYTVGVKLHRDVTANLKVWVVREEDQKK
jgi:large subunit ribosomal protein L9